MIYLDNASTTQVDARLKDAICEYMFENYGNAGSPHVLGKLSRDAIEIARKEVAESVNADKDDVIFTSCGSEANTLAIVGLANHLLSLNLTHVITTKYEHHSVLNAMKEMERRGFDVTYLDVQDGIVSYDDVIASLRDDTGLVSIMYINNETGSTNNIRQIYKLCKDREVLFHSDCVQAFGSVPVDMKEMADMISLSGHKVHAPKGIGCLCTKYKQFLSNIIYGGGQEFGLRPGTENISNIVAFGKMAKYSERNRNENTSYIQKLSFYFSGKLMQLCEENGIIYHFNAIHYMNSPKILSVRFDDIDAETLMIMLNANGVCVSSSSACSSHSVQPSHVLKAIGLSDDNAKSTIRVSFSEYNTVEEVEKAAEIIVQCVLDLKNVI